MIFKLILTFLVLATTSILSKWKNANCVSKNNIFKMWVSPEYQARISAKNCLFSFVWTDQNRSINISKTILFRFYLLHNASTKKNQSLNFFIIFFWIFKKIMFDAKNYSKLSKMAVCWTLIVLWLRWLLAFRTFHLH